MTNHAKYPRPENDILGFCKWTLENFVIYQTKWDFIIGLITDI